MIKAEMVVRDVVYLGWECVRFMSAQLLGGGPQGASSEKGHDVGSKGEAQGDTTRREFGILSERLPDAGPGGAVWL